MTPVPPRGVMTTGEFLEAAARIAEVPIGSSTLPPDLVPEEEVRQLTEIQKLGRAKLDSVLRLLAMRSPQFSPKPL